MLDLEDSTLQDALIWRVQHLGLSMDTINVLSVRFGNLTTLYVFFYPSGCFKLYYNSLFCRALRNG